MASTGEEGAKKLQSNCAFYEELDDILGTWDAINPDCMTISSSKVIPKKKSPSAGPVSKEGENSSSSASSDSQQPSTSSASDESPPKSQQVPPKTKGKAPKRKRKEQNDQDEDPYMKGIRDVAYFHGKASRTLQPQHGTSAGCYTKPDRADQGSCVRPKRHFKRLFKK